MIPTLRVHYEGSVQGVGFRYTVKTIAREFDVAGSVRNLSDGRVELFVQGEEDDVAAFLEAIRSSHLSGHIRTEYTENLEMEPFKGFQIAA